MQRFDNGDHSEASTRVAQAGSVSAQQLSLLELLVMFLVVLLLVAGCQTVSQPTPEPIPTVAIAAEPAPVEPLATRQRVLWPELPGPAKAFDEAVFDAAHALLSMVELPAPDQKYLLVIDPPVDALSGVQSHATHKIEARVAELVRKKFPQFSLRPFTPASVRQSPLLLIGALTPVNASGQAEGQRQDYRLCLALADLNSGKVLSKETARLRLHGINHTPTSYFQDSPAWMHDRAVDRYVETCEASKPGAPVQDSFLAGLANEALINQGIAAYDGGRYKEALERFSAAANASADQLRIESGLYLSNTKLGRSAEAKAAFGKIIEHALAENRLAMNFLFRPGSASFALDKSPGDSYSMWLQEIGRQALQSDSCLEVIGHTTRTGTEALNEKLSLDRAEYIKNKLEGETAKLAGRTTARGAGSHENLVGIGKDDLSDALDRRVVFQVIPCAVLTSQTANRY
jgi:outer membrane protein OmpA-like peptidoglycan-associated protein